MWAAPVARAPSQLREQAGVSAGCETTFGHYSHPPALSLSYFRLLHAIIIRTYLMFHLPRVAYIPQHTRIQAMQAFRPILNLILHNLQTALENGQLVK